MRDSEIKHCQSWREHYYAADRGLDMYSNWGPAIQIKHLSLDVELAKNIVDAKMPTEPEMP